MACPSSGGLKAVATSTSTIRRNTCTADRSQRLRQDGRSQRAQGILRHDRGPSRSTGRRDRWPPPRPPAMASADTSRTSYVRRHEVLTRHGGRRAATPRVAARPAEAATPLAALDFVGIASRAGARVGSLQIRASALVEFPGLAGSPKICSSKRSGGGLNQCRRNELSAYSSAQGAGLTYYKRPRHGDGEQVADHTRLLHLASASTTGTREAVFAPPRRQSRLSGRERPGTVKVHGAH